MPVEESIHNRKYYAFLDGWRGLAMLWIIVGHIIFLYSGDFSSGINRLLLVFPRYIFIPVDIFLVLSGFLVTGVLLQRSINFDIKAFIKNRIRRILPLYFIISIIVIVLFNYIIPEFYISAEKIMSPEDPKQYTFTGVRENFFVALDDDKKGEVVLLPSSTYVKDGNKIYQRPVILTGKASSKFTGTSVLPYLLFYQNYVPNQERILFLGHTWFISVIMHFYIIFAVACLIIYRFIDSRKKRTAFFFFFLLSLIIAINILRAKAGVTYTDADHFQMTYFRVDAIFFGCLLRLGENLFGNFKKQGLFWDHGLPLLFFGAGLGMLLTLVLSYNSPYLFIFEQISIGLMIIATHQKTLFSRLIFENPVLGWIGRHSYGIYLWHYPFMFLYYITWRYIHLSNLTSIFIYMLLSIVIGGGLDRLFSRRTYRSQVPYY